MDFEAAFDKVSKELLVQELIDNGMPQYLICMLISLLFQSMSYHIVVNGTASKKLDRNIGLPQGSPLSPVIFKKFINSLVSELNPTIVTKDQLPSALFFADDGVLLAIDWAHATAMKFNVSKFGVIDKLDLKKNKAFNYVSTEYRYLS